ncbi:MAG: group II intron reverse transcriptase/maturase, partial [Planctomycetes bacterium]|nr:group II intron reverse transcriptase/maturase [Planctomycetota bacterium]
SVISPLLSNLFMHYAFDEWLRRNFPHIQFARYADDAVIHARSLAEAKQVLEAVRLRLLECGLELHPEKTKIVYCQDSDRRGSHDHIQFDFLGYTFRPRRAKNRWGKMFISFLPAVSNKAASSIRATIRSWRLGATRNNQSLEEIAKFVNPYVRGWVNYYGRFYKSALTPVLRCLERSLVYWARRKFKRLRRHQRRAVHWLGRVARREPNLFEMWRIGIRSATG